MRFRFLFCFIALILVVLPVASFGADAVGDRRVALVIGNNDYQHAKKLDNAVADAQAFRRELETRGFDVVYRENANRRTMNSAMEEFMGKLSTDTVGMIFYSGHGVQINGANYLVPTDLLAKVPADFVYDAVDLSKLIDRVAKTQAKFSLAVIDACRDNPFQGNGRDIGGTRGLVAPTGDATGVMIVYSAGANQKALDRLGETDRNPNGLFTREFLKAIRVPGLTVQEAVNQIKATVISQAKSVGYVQTPAIYDQSVGTFYFTPGKAPAPVAKLEQQTLQQAVQTVDPSVMELEFWNGIKDRNSKEEFSAYLEQYPQGRFAPLARARMLTITRQVSADSASADKVAADKAAADRATSAKVLADKAAAERVAADKAAADKIASEKLAADKLAADKAASEKRVLPVAGQTIKDCADCPEMVVIPAGSFLMGAPATEKDRQEDEGPAHQVRISYSLALGKHELTRGEFSRFATASGYKTEAERSQSCAAWDGKAWAYDASKNWRNPGFPQTDSHPVVCVSWNDAQAYLTWLNEKAPGKGFRLPSEAEWEYAARAGQGTARFPWGDDLDYSQICSYANSMDITGTAQVPGVNWKVASCIDRHARTAPAGSFKANAFGLFDTHGNVWEWVQDVWHENYQGAPGDGSAWLSGGDQAGRVIRGGSWSNNPRALRSASRLRHALNFSFIDAGMRIARTH
jgi:formylglycine-generating enzyme required for sulfatase activity